MLGFELKRLVTILVYLGVEFGIFAMMINLISWAFNFDCDFKIALGTWATVKLIKTLFK